MDEDEVSAVLDVLDRRVERFTWMSAEPMPGGSIPGDVADQLEEHIHSIHAGLGELSAHLGGDGADKLDDVIYDVRALDDLVGGERKNNAKSAALHVQNAIILVDELIKMRVPYKTACRLAANCATAGGHPLTAEQVFEAARHFDKKWKAKHGRPFITRGG